MKEQAEAFSIRSERDDMLFDYRGYVRRMYLYKNLTVPIYFDEIEDVLHPKIYPT